MAVRSSVASAKTARKITASSGGLPHLHLLFQVFEKCQPRREGFACRNRQFEFNRSCLPWPTQTVPPSISLIPNNRRAGIAHSGGQYLCRWKRKLLYVICNLLFKAVPLVVNRRKYGRIGIGNQPCLIRMDGAATQGYIIDESIGGIRVGGVPLLHLFINQNFTIEYDDTTISGFSRTVSRGSDGLFEIGLIRELESNTTSSDAILINSFWEIDGVSFVCLPRNVIDEETLSISFPDGKEFQVPIQDVAQMTRDERSEYLLDAEIRKKVGQVYGTMYNNPTIFSDRRSILTHEFGIAAK